ncbi:MAG: glycosyltransferase family 4 protein [Mycolicibacterium sp.]|nr:glycosyltransferase family 4 protein [Mycolicibacterium sp.]
MVCARALPLMGGIETHVHEVSRRLADAGVEVTVLTTDTSGTLPADEIMSGYRIRRWPSYPRSRDYYFSPGLARYLRQTREYDVVHIQGVHTLVPPMALATTLRAHIPTVLTFHTGGHSSGSRESARPLQWKLLAPLLRRAAALVAVCEFERTKFALALGVPESSIRLIRNGCDPLPVDPSAPKPPGSPLVVSFGRLVDYKGHHRVLQAMPAILARQHDARLTLIGSGPYEQHLRDMAEELGVADRMSIRSFGPGERTEMGNIVANADVVCLLSDYEAHPIAVMEAIGTGSKVLVADTSGLSELGREGLATAIPLEASSEQIASAVLSLAAAPRTAPPYVPTWNDCAQELLKLYLEVTA